MFKYLQYKQQVKKKKKGNNFFHVQTNIGRDFSTSDILPVLLQ